MTISQETIEKLNASIAAIGARLTAKKLVDQYLRRKIGLISDDLADTSTFANGLDEIEALLGQNDFQEAFAVAKDTASAMLEDEGGMEGLFEVRTIVRNVVKEEMVKQKGISATKRSIDENFYQNLQPKEAIQKAMIDHDHALKQNNTGQADKIAGNLKSHLESLRYNWKQDPYAMEVLADFV